MGARHKPDRSWLYTIIAIALLLYGLFMLIADNDRKYRMALATAAAGIEQTRVVLTVTPPA